MKQLTKELIAPCGMNCAVCSKYLAFVNNWKGSRCSSCRVRGQRCTYLFAKCSGINNNIVTINTEFCFECEQYPCKEIKRMDKRYRDNYSVSTKDNLDNIKEQGIDKFREEQYKKHSCTKCGELISVHNRKCFKCEAVTNLVEKVGKEQ